MSKKPDRKPNVYNSGCLIIFISTFLAVAIMSTGIELCRNISEYQYGILKIIRGVCCGAVIALFPLNIFLKTKYVNKKNAMKADEVSNFLISSREAVEKTAAEKLAFIQKWRRLTDFYTVLIAASACVIAFCPDAVFVKESSNGFVMFSAFLFITAFSRMRFPVNKKIFKADKTAISPEEYPQLYALVKRAADTLNCKGEIKITVLPDCNAGISKIGNIYSVILGVPLVSIYSSEELYNILLHEFAHVISENDSSNKERAYIDWLCCEGKGTFLSCLTDIPFSFFDAVYYFHYNVYSYATSVKNETEADSVMARYGNPRTAASALLKLKYNELFEWEDVVRDEKNPYVNEEIDTNVIHDKIALFKNAVKENAERWNQAAQAEIISRSASHPTLKMRFETLGVTEYAVEEYVSSKAYEEECEKLVDFAETLIYEQRIETYDEDRERFYLNPKSTADKWEADGKPIIAEEYSEVIDALVKLGRCSDVYELCDRAIAQLSDSAACYALFIKGSYLLHEYDPAGIELLYKAVDINKNYYEEALDIIGQFSCLTGRQEELDRYREKVMDLTQKDIDVYSKANTLSAKDNLCTEHLPDGILDDILSHVLQCDDGTVQNIYLVRKVISDDFFTSAVVLRFAKEASPEKKEEIFSKTFSFLDTSSDWQFSLFDYDDVKKVRLEKIEGSCVYSKK